MPLNTPQHFDGAANIMKSLVDWLHRLATVTPEDGPEIGFFRVSVSGTDPLDIGNWLLSIDPQGLLSNSLQATGPESWSVMRLPDLPRIEASVHDRHRLGADLACVLSLALDRRVVVSNDIAMQIPQLEKVVFHPVSQVVDLGLLGPLPPDAKQRINAYISSVAGLALGDQEIIGAASSAYHGAILLFDREPRAAYTLLVTGIEVLSRKYGSPPTGWTNWEDSSTWDRFFLEQDMTIGQASAFRDRIMHDKQLRLAATFQDYASTRLREDFWDKPLDQWIYGIDANTGAWLPPTKVKASRVSDYLPLDRTTLKKSLGKTYSLRSLVVHEAHWVELMTLAQPPVNQPQGARILPFPILRALLAELIWIEISAHALPTALPDFQLLRGK